MKPVQIIAALILTVSASAEAEVNLQENWRSHLAPRDIREVELALAVEEMKQRGNTSGATFWKLPPDSQREINFLTAMKQVRKDVSIDTIWSEIKMRRMFDDLEEAIIQTK